MDFPGDKAGVRLTYGGNFTIWGTIIMIPPTDGRGYSYAFTSCEAPHKAG